MFAVVLNGTQEHSENGLDFLHNVSYLVQFFWNSYSICLPTDNYYHSRQIEIPFSVFLYHLDLYPRHCVRAGSPIVTRTELHNYWGLQGLQTHLS